MFNGALCRAEINGGSFSFHSDDSNLRLRPSGGGVTFTANYSRKTNPLYWV